MRRVFRAHPNRPWTTEFGCSTRRLIERSFLALNPLDAAIVAVRKVPMDINIIDGSVPHRGPQAGTTTASISSSPILQASTATCRQAVSAERDR